MNRLFVELYLDEDVDVLVADLVRARGFKATTTQEAGQIQNSDAEQLAYAIKQQATVLTHNRVHFEAQAREYFAAGRTNYGIIIAVPRPYSYFVSLIFISLNKATPDQEAKPIRSI